MQIGVITIDGSTVGVVSLNADQYSDPFTPDLDGYVPEGRAAEAPMGGPQAAPQGGGDHGGHHRPHGGQTHHGQPQGGQQAPAGKTYQSESRGAPVHQGSAETDQAIVDAARAHHLDPNTMRSIASIESGMNPSSNAHRATQYKGLYQVGRNEWDRFGAGGNIYSAHDNAMATGRMFEANRGQFRSHFGRDPTDTETYMMHQQGLGFYTNGDGKITNAAGNPYPGMHGPQTHESFEAGWGRELARRKAGLAGTPHAPVAETPAMPDNLFAGSKAKPYDFSYPDKGTPEWGQKDWNDMHHSGNIEDRRKADQSTKGMSKRDMLVNKFVGEYDTLKRADAIKQSPSTLSSDLGIENLLPDEDLAEAEKINPDKAP